MLTPGTRLVDERYELERQLGEGGFGEVWRAHDQVTEQTVALKLLFDRHNRNAEVVERFEREVQIGVWLNHPAIPRVLDAGFDPLVQRRYFAMEFVDGAPLGEKPLSFAALVDVFVQLCGALAFAHARGVVHRDLKPDNVLITTLDGQPSIKLLDFGIVRLTEGALANMAASTTTTLREDAPMGSAFWMSPEQARGESLSAGPASDLYSLGVMLYEQLSGDVPFRGSLLNVLYKHMMEPPPAIVVRSPYPDPLPATIRGLLESLLQKEYSNRPEFAADVRWSFAKLAQTLPSALVSERVPVYLDASRPYVPVDTMQGGEALAGDQSKTFASGVNTFSDAGDDHALMATLGAESGALQSSQLSHAEHRSLLRLQDFPLVGRASARQALLARADFDAPEVRLVTLGGPSGTGKSRLARWFSEEVHETGVMRVIRVRLDERGSLTAALQAAFYNSLRNPLLERTPLLKRIGECLAFDAEADTAALCDFILSGSVNIEEMQTGVTGRMGAIAIPAAISLKALRQLALYPAPRPLLIWLDGSGRESAQLVAYWLTALEKELSQHLVCAIALCSTAEVSVLSNLKFSEQDYHETLGPLNGEERRELIELIAPGVEKKFVDRLTSRFGENTAILKELALELAEKRSTEVSSDNMPHLASVVIDIANVYETLLNSRVQRIVDALGEPDRISRALLGTELARSEPAGVPTRDAGWRVLLVFALLGQNFENAQARAVFSHFEVGERDLVGDGLLRWEQSARGPLLAISSAAMKEALLQRAMGRADLDELIDVACEVRLHTALSKMGQSDWEAARHQLAEAWELLDSCQQAEDDERRFYILNGFAWVSSRQGESRFVESHAANLAERGVAAGKTHWQEIAVTWRAAAAIHSEQYDQAEELCDVNLGDFVHPLSTNLLLLRRGQLARVRGDLDKALASELDATRGLHRIHGEGGSQHHRQLISFMLADAYQDLSEVYHLRGELEPSERTIRLALELYESLGDLRSVSRAHLQLARIYRTQLEQHPGEQIASRAQQHLRSAESALRTLDDRLGQAILAWEAARLAVACQEKARAAALFERAGHLFGAAGNRNGAAACANGSGELLREMGHLDEAEAAYLSFIKVSDELGSSLHSGTGRANLGWVEIARGDFLRANQHFDEALRIFGEKAPGVRTAPARIGLAESLLALDRRAEATTLLERWRGSFTPDAFDSDVSASLERAVTLAQALDWEDVVRALGALRQEL